MQLYWKFHKFNTITQKSEEIWCEINLAGAMQDICCESDYDDGQLEAIRRSISRTAEKLGELTDILHQKGYLQPSDVLELLGSSRYKLAPSEE